MSHLAPLPTLHSPQLCEEELEDAFLAWADSPAKPDAVRLSGNRYLTMLELSRRLRSSNARLSDPASETLGLPQDATIAAAVAVLLHATVDPDGPQCRSFRSASLFLRGLARLEATSAFEEWAPLNDTSANGSKNGSADGNGVDPMSPTRALHPAGGLAPRARRAAPANDLRVRRGPALFPAIGARQPNRASKPPEKEHA